MKKINIVHLHTDPKFIRAYKHYSENKFNNTTFFLTKGRKLLFEEKNVETITVNKKSINQIINICNNSDIVVFYGMGSWFSYILRFLNNDIITVWRVFGGEVYSNNLSMWISDKELKYMREYMIKQKLRLWLKNINGIISFDKLQIPVDIMQIKKRIDYVLLTSYEEYELLSSLFGSMPEFIQAPFSFLPYTYVKTNKKNQIIIGNSASVFNNHFEIIDIIKKSQDFNNYTSLIFPLSYPNYFKKYKSQLLSEINSIKNATVLSSFIQKKEYDKLFLESKAFIINSKRQHGLGNIKIALRNGLKIYLNPENLIYKTLKNEGFHLFTIENFEHDFKNDNLELTDKELSENRDTYLSCRSKYSNERLNAEIFQISKK